MRRLIPNLIIAGLLAGAVVGYAELGTADPRGDSPRATAAGKDARHLKVRGHVNGLYPGAVDRMRVKVRNGYRGPIVLRGLRATARDAGPGCPGRSLWMRRFRGHRQIGAHQSHRVRLRIGMKASAPDACQGQRFPLHFEVEKRARR